jgi:hypothetical protein
VARFAKDEQIVRLFVPVGVPQVVYLKTYRFVCGDAYAVTFSPE